MLHARLCWTLDCWDWALAHEQTRLKLTLTPALPLDRVTPYKLQLPATVDTVDCMHPLGLFWSWHDTNGNWRDRKEVACPCMKALTKSSLWQVMATLAPRSLKKSAWQQKWRALRLSFAQDPSQSAYWVTVSLQILHGNQSKNHPKNHPNPTKPRF